MPTLAEEIAKGRAGFDFDGPIDLTDELRATADVLTLGKDKNKVVTAISPAGTTQRIPAPLPTRPEALNVNPPQGLPQPSSFSQALGTPAIQKFIAALGQGIAGQGNPVNVIGDAAISAAESNAQAAFFGRLSRGEPVESIQGPDVAGLSAEGRLQTIQAFRLERETKVRETAEKRLAKESDARITDAEAAGFRDERRVDLLEFKTIFDSDQDAKRFNLLSDDQTFDQNLKTLKFSLETEFTQSRIALTDADILLTDARTSLANRTDPNLRASGGPGLNLARISNALTDQQKILNGFEQKLTTARNTLAATEGEDDEASVRLAKAARQVIETIGPRIPDVQRSINRLRKGLNSVVDEVDASIGVEGSAAPQSGDESSTEGADNVTLQTARDDLSSALEAADATAIRQAADTAVQLGAITNDEYQEFLSFANGFDVEQEDERGTLVRPFRSPVPLIEIVPNDKTIVTPRGSFNLPFKFQFKRKPKEL